jgi:guanylate kinase
MQTLPHYDNVVVNDDLCTAADEVRSIFLAEQRRVRNINGVKPKP